jgi:hypothetical protein
VSAGPAESVSGIEFQGQLDRAGDAGRLLALGALAAAWIGHAARHDAQRFDQFESGEVRAQAVVRSTTERQVGCRRLAGDIEPVGIVVHGRIALGRSRRADGARPRGDRPR